MCLNAAGVLVVADKEQSHWSQRTKVQGSARPNYLFFQKCLNISRENNILGIG